MGGKIDKIFWGVKKLNHSLRWLGVGCLLFLAAVVVNEVFMRSVFNHPISTTVELGRTIQIYLGFMCAGYVQSTKAHLNMEDLLVYLKPRTKKVTLMLGSLMGALYCGFMAYESWIMVLHSVHTGEVTLMLEWPMAVVKLPTLIGFTLLAAQFVADAWIDYRAVEDHISTVDLPS